jgi:membrane protease YdiL (CAAX protease family)
MPFLAHAILATLLALLVAQSGLSPDDFGIVQDRWKQSFAAGILAAAVWRGFYAAVVYVARPDLRDFSRRWDMRVSFRYWVALSMSSAVVEEVWRAFCLVALMSKGSVFSVTITAAAFGLAHAQPFGRALSMTLFAVYTAWLFLATQSLWSTVPAHFVVNLGVFALIRLKARAAFVDDRNATNDQSALRSGGGR